MVAEGPADLAATATVVERLGDRTLVYARLADGSLVTAQDKGISAVEPGAALNLRVDPSALHLFDGKGSARPVRALAPV